MGGIDLKSAVIHLPEGLGAAEIPMGPDFWSNMDPRLESGRMVSLIHTAADWQVWECHPAGEEVIVALSGSLALILEGEGPEPERIVIAPGEAAIVPTGVWHTADVIAPGDALYITPGAGTVNRPR